MKITNLKLVILAISLYSTTTQHALGASTGAREDIRPSNSLDRSRSSEFSSSPPQSKAKASRHYGHDTVEMEAARLNRALKLNQCALEAQKQKESLGITEDGWQRIS